MKKFLVAVAIVLFMSTVAFAEPFLTCDPQPDYDVSHYIITGDISVTVQAIPAPKQTGFVVLWYDLKDLPVGEYKINVVAQGDAWPSDPTPFTFTKSLVVAPKSLRIER